jgi:hypothetical protein
MEQEVALELRHAEFVLRDYLRELLRQLLMAIIEIHEKILDLMLWSVIKFDMDIRSARSQKGWVQLLLVVGGHDWLKLN